VTCLNKIFVKTVMGEIIKPGNRPGLIGVGLEMRFISGIDKGRVYVDSGKGNVGGGVQDGDLLQKGTVSPVNKMGN